MEKYERTSNDSQSDISQGVILPSNLVEDESYHSAKSEGDEVLSPPAGPTVERAEEAPVRREPQEPSREANRDVPAVPKMHIDPEEPRDESTAGKYRPGYRNQRRNGGYQYPQLDIMPPR